MYHLPACAWRIILIHKCLVSMVWLYPPRIQSSPPAWHYIFRIGDLQAKPSFCHCRWLDSRHIAGAFFWAVQTFILAKGFVKKMQRLVIVGGRSKVWLKPSTKHDVEHVWWLAALSSSSTRIRRMAPWLWKPRPHRRSTFVLRFMTFCLVPNKEHMRDLRSC